MFHFESWGHVSLIAGARLFGSTDSGASKQKALPTRSAHAKRHPSDLRTEKKEITALLTRLRSKSGEQTHCWIPYAVDSSHSTTNSTKAALTSKAEENTAAEPD